MYLAKKYIVKEGHCSQIEIKKKFSAMITCKYISARISFISFLNSTNFCLISQKMNNNKY